MTEQNACKQRLQDALESLHDGPRSVPCNGCTRCCKNERIGIVRELGDDFTKLTSHHGEDESGLATLKQKPDGSCIYLGESGCTVHEYRPYMCRIYDCRLDFLRWMRRPRQRKQLMRSGKLSSEVMTAGAARLHTLTPAERKAGRAVGA